MSKSVNEALQRYRARQARRGHCRLEVTVPEEDRDAIREIAAVLRKGGARADRLRFALECALQDRRPPSFEELLESAPLEGLDLERIRDYPRDVEF